MRLPIFKPVDTTGRITHAGRLDTSLFPTLRVGDRVIPCDLRTRQDAGRAGTRLGNLLRDA